MSDCNVLGGALEQGGTDPLTGFYRDGCCATGPEDLGWHTICAVMTTEFLAHQRSVGNDLSIARPVLAAAVRERAEVIVTTNLKHFPDDALKPYQIKALHPDDFLLDQLDLYEEATKAVILGMVDAYIDPPFTPHSLLDALGEQVPQFAAKARRLFPSGSPFGLGVLLPFDQ